MVLRSARKQNQSMAVLIPEDRLEILYNSGMIFKRDSFIQTSLLSR